MEFWFGKQSLLIFDFQQQKCLVVVELSHFYGGDGGQTPCTGPVDGPVRSAEIQRSTFHQ